jgi:hypothetical protein
MVSELTLRAVLRRIYKTKSRKNVMNLVQTSGICNVSFNTVKGSRLFSVLILCVFLQVSYSILLVFGLVESYDRGEHSRGLTLNSELQLSFYGHHVQY